MLEVYFYHHLCSLDTWQWQCSWFFLYTIFMDKDTYWSHLGAWKVVCTKCPPPQPSVDTGLRNAYGNNQSDLWPWLMIFRTTGYPLPHDLFQTLQYEATFQIKKQENIRIFWNQMLEKRSRFINTKVSTTICSNIHCIWCKSILSIWRPP